MNPGEIEMLIWLVGSVRPQGVLEFGVHEGMTAQALLQNIKSILVYQGIDDMPGYRPGCHVQRYEVPQQAGRLVKGDPRFELLLRPRGSLDLKPWDLCSCDVAFIDGDHSAAAVWHDTDLATALVRPGGLIIFHDYSDRGTVDVRDVLDEMYLAGRPLQRIDNTWLAFERR
jgi:predicted O-methyltransferase YrrM